MTRIIQVLVFLFVFTAGFLLGCKDRRKLEDVQSDYIDSNNGISPRTLDLIYDGPKGLTLEYFPSEIMRSGHISDCEVIEMDSTSEKVTRKIKFDSNGNIISDKNNYFQYWFNGTTNGNYLYYYDSANRFVKMVGKSENEGTDSIMTIKNFSRNGLLSSRDRYEYAKLLKPGADKHLPSSGDFEKDPTWNKIESYRYMFEANILIIETVIEGKNVEKEKYVLDFDSLGRLTSTSKNVEGLFGEVVTYSYDSNSISESVRRIMIDGDELMYNSKSIIDDKGRQTQKILFNDDGSEKVRMITSYNQDGTISRIDHNGTIQVFRYSYYQH